MNKTAQAAAQTSYTAPTLPEAQARARARRKPPKPAGIEFKPDLDGDEGEDSGARKMVSFRSDSDVMERLKQIASRTGNPYQRLLRRALRDFVAKAEAAGI